ncbi:phosphate ABC transporter permease PstA [Granulicatella sp. zg-ZJ]|uniref:phosphate ABC transporter permease PstA n=1 Tax=unclassified Granulicatella TaxID=2630493 RepID=UPI0013BF7F76|nr:MULTISPECIES: phosphate ABC transporter permease PstA [unclassified Granulicatella]MBS4750755.1 phosphate ABC transporter permease PstA [Carnobacteriaceae bacterium zg-ZUI78]NEW62593.1 phosphate ABC transporter permease PstA [Granulicatella sp. zg-ZJ]NEW66698.1 phosphate ABC transporter permease PstA [Granulicatella sp. zg-84]QMI85993.1 phosphate ABC transporter permease PstA [Carnobacteriaceae bacterium zg-84]
MNAKQQDKIATIVLYSIAGVICLILASLVGYVLIHGIEHVNWRFLTSNPESIKAGGGILPELWNSFYLLVLTLLISTPISLGAAIYLSEYAPKNKTTEFIRLSVDVLSSLPSIVVGLFGMLLFVTAMKFKYSILSGALTLTIFNLPILVRVMEQSLRNISHDQRQAGLGLGLTKWETTIFVVVPAALPGILTGIILSAGRIFGEAAALLFTAGQSAPALDFTNWNPFSPRSPLNMFRQAETLAVHIWKVNSEAVVPDAQAVSNGTAAVLILFILIFNFVARRFGQYLYKKMTSAK